jgi:hypothetical protein
MNNLDLYRLARFTRPSWHADSAPVGRQLTDLDDQIPLVDLRRLVDERGQPIRFTTRQENRALDRKRRRANRIIIRNRYACAVALATVIALRQRPAPASELKFLIANPDVPSSTARKAARDLGAWK